MTQQRKVPKGRIAKKDLDLALDLHREMLKVRLFETRVGELFEGGEIPGFVHLSLGQESVAAGVVGALDETDYITTTHRGHGHIIAKGAEFGPMLAELMGRATGYCRGKGGSMHIFDKSAGVLGANGILGAGQPIAVGAAYAAHLDGRNDVAVTFFGEGASAQGAVHEAMNLAAVLKLPVLFVAEINGYAELTPFDVHSSVESLAVRSQAYGFGSTSLDAMDALQVRKTTDEILTEMRAGGGPHLLELRTLRWSGHFEGDPQRYRDPADLERRADVDPVAHMRRRLLASGVSESQLDEMEAEIKSELEKAIEESRSAPMPEPTDALEDVYANPLVALGEVS